MNTSPQKGDSSIPQNTVLQDGTSSLATSRSQGERALPYLLALMETCWIDAILIAIAGTTSLHTLWVPFVVIAGSCWLAKSFSQVNRDSASSALSLPGTLLVVLLLVGTALFSLWNGLYASSIAFYDPTWLVTLLSDVFLLGNEAFRIIAIIGLICYFYWRGLRLARTMIEPGNVFFGIRLGIGVMLAVIVYRAATGTSAFNEAWLLLLLPLFLVAALIAHAFAQTSFVRTLHNAGLQGSVSLQERALFVISIAFGAVLFLTALVVDAFASPAFLTEVQGFFSPLGIAYNWLADAIAFVVTLIVAPFVLLLQLLHFRLPQSNIKVKQPSSPLTKYCLSHPHAIQCAPPQSGPNDLLLMLIKIILPIVVVMLVVLIVVLFVRMRRVRVARGSAEVHESLWSWELFLTQVRALLLALWLRLFPRRPVVALEQGGIDDERAVEPTARSIREVYRAMLRWAADRGYPRKKDETPFEFRHRLRARLPLAEPELGTMTDAYTAIRYGRAVASDADVARIQQTWSHLRQKPMNNNNPIS